MLLQAYAIGVFQHISP